MIFDLDGVLINSLPNMQYALKKTSLYLDQKIHWFTFCKNYVEYGCDRRL